MDRPFTSFVVFAEMRTGSNFLEQNINQFEDLKCHGELFNPHFIGELNKESVLGYSLQDRERDPEGLIKLLRASDVSTVPGFRFFNDHDPRILKAVLADPACGKVVLTRNALDSYVSRKIAAATNQWKLTNFKHQKTAQIKFNLPEFENHLNAIQGFQTILLNALQTSGQTAFYINYDDIHDLDVLNGLARFLGSRHQATGLKKNLKRQNPEPLDAKVANYTTMLDDLKQIDFLAMSRTPTFEPRRGAGVPQFIASSEAKLLFMPVFGGPVDRVRAWLLAHQANGTGGLDEEFNQKTLRQWRLNHPGFQSFTVLRHPVARAYHGFEQFVVKPQSGGQSEIREAIRRDYGVAVPEDGKLRQGYDPRAHKAAFLAFLKFLKANLSEQTGMRINPSWASQTAVLEGASSVSLAENIMHEDIAQQTLAHLEDLLGLPKVAFPAQTEAQYLFELAEIYDENIEDRVRDIYLRDYINFGFSAWGRAK